MPRFLKVRGKPGLLVSHPHVDADPRRFVGQTMIAMPDDAEGHHIERHEPTEEVVLDEAIIRVAIRHEELVLIAETTAPTHAKAVAVFEKSLAKAPAVAAMKGTDK